MPRSFLRHASRPRLELLEVRELPATYTVINTADAGAGSLRQAILDANVNTGSDTINFSIGSGVQTITPLSALPVVTDPVRILGYTQPGFADTPVIEINGAHAGTNASGLVITAGSSEVWNLAINRFPEYGIDINGSGNNLLVGNFIGTDSAGANALGNAIGVRILNSNNNDIGMPGGANLVSGNAEHGLLLFNSQGNIIEGNYIGTDVSGTLVLGNGHDGISVQSGANGNTIGGVLSTATNIISGNGGAGVHFSGLGTTNNSVIRNHIGTDVTGTGKISNGIGVFINQGASNNVVGGISSTARNIISGNQRIGVAIAGNNTNANRVEGNYIGTDWTGSVALGNPVGVSIFRMAKDNIIGGTGPSRRNVISGNISTGILIRVGGTIGNDVIRNYIGTDSSGNLPIPNRVGITVNDSASDSLIDANVIAFNTTEGVLVENATSIQMRVNVIRDNGSKGIRLLNNGNSFQPFPIITSVTNGDGSITITGTLTAAASTTFRLEFFSNPVCDGSGFGEGQSYIGAKSVVTSGAGSAAFSATFTANIPSGHLISATATSPTGDTSEFAACMPASLPPPGPDGHRPPFMATMSANTTPVNPLHVTAKSMAVDHELSESFHNAASFPNDVRVPVNYTLKDSRPLFKRPRIRTEWLVDAAASADIGEL